MGDRNRVPCRTNETPLTFGNLSVSKVGTKGATVVVIVVIVRLWLSIVRQG